jgi:hypothetical protein
VARKKYKLSSDGGDSGCKKCKRGYDGEVCVWRESGFSRREDVFTFNSLLYKEIL